MIEHDSAPVKSSIGATAICSSLAACTVSGQFEVVSGEDADGRCHDAPNAVGMRYSDRATSRVDHELA